MNDFWFYIQMGLDHVLDLSAYDHILFLSALAIPFTFKSWKQVIILATIFTIAHCASLALSVYDVVRVDVGLIEFLIPVTIALTALFNLYKVLKKQEEKGGYFHGLATTFFGLVHGFGFSNYFNMLMAEEPDKLTPLLGFATGIELSQVTIILLALLIAYLAQNIFKLKQTIYIGITSILVLLVTIPMLIDTFPS